MDQNLNTLIIVSHVVHYVSNNRLFAYGPYSREIDIWADLFPQILIASPVRFEAPPGDAVEFTRRNISMVPQKERGGEDLKAKLLLFFSLPEMILGLSRAMRKGDAIHVRCPGNLGLLGVILAPLFSKYIVAKYAGQWTGYPGEAPTVRFQRALLRSRWWKGPVTVYGRWPLQPSHVVPFFTSVLTADQIERARVASRYKKIAKPVRILYVGRLSADKNVDVILKSTARLRTHGIDINCEIVGEGAQWSALQALAAELGLDDCVHFTGGVSFDKVLESYERADVLVLVSETEGWPKAIAEAMAFGLVCIGTNRGLVPEMLSNGRGVIIPPGDEEALTTALREITAGGQEYELMSARAAAWSQEYSLERLRESLSELLTEYWRVEVSFSASHAALLKYGG